MTAEIPAAGPVAGILWSCCGRNPCRSLDVLCTAAATFAPVCVPRAAPDLAPGGLGAALGLLTGLRTRGCFSLPEHFLPPTAGAAAAWRDAPEGAASGLGEPTRRSELARGTAGVTGQSNGSSRGIAERHAEVRHVVVAAAVRRGGTSPVCGARLQATAAAPLGPPSEALWRASHSARAAPLPVPFLRSRQGQVSWFAEVM